MEQNNQNPAEEQNPQGAPQAAPAVHNIDVSQLTAEQKNELLRQLGAELKDERTQKREAYESLRADFMHRVDDFLVNVTADVVGFKKWLGHESEAFIGVMREYGQVKNEGQQNYTITDGDFRLQVSSNKVKAFDERADLAAERLVAFLKAYMQKSDKGKDDPMYQLAMTLLERNQAGDLDYKSISKLYELEDKFGDPEYSDIMQLFKESNVVQKTATNYYFWRRSKETGVWSRIEPSFCRL